MAIEEEVVLEQATLASFDSLPDGCRAEILIRALRHYLRNTDATPGHCPHHGTCLGGKLLATLNALVGKGCPGI